MATQEQSTQVLELYTAYFNRAADKAGVDYWLSEMNNNNWTVDMVAITFAQQTEYTNLYAGLSNAQIVAQVYTNVLNRTADTAGADYWEGELTNGNISVTQLVQAVINAATELDANGIYKNSNDAELFNNKIEVSQYFYDKGINETGVSLADITQTDSTMQSLKEYADAQASSSNETTANFIEGQSFSIQSTNSNIEATYFIVNDHIALEFLREDGFLERDINSYTINLETNSITMKNAASSGNDFLTINFPDNHLDVGDRGTIVADGGNDGFVITSVKEDALYGIEKLSSYSYTPAELTANYNEPLMWDDWYYTDVVITPDASEIIIYKESTNHIEIQGINGWMQYTLDM